MIKLEELTVTQTLLDDWVERIIGNSPEVNEISPVNELKLSKEDLHGLAHKIVMDNKVKIKSKSEDLNYIYAKEQTISTNSTDQLYKTYDVPVITSNDLLKTYKLRFNDTFDKFVRNDNNFYLNEYELMNFIMTSDFTTINDFINLRGGIDPVYQNLANSITNHLRLSGIAMSFTQDEELKLPFYYYYYNKYINNGDSITDIDVKQIVENLNDVAVYVYDNKINEEETLSHELISDVLFTDCIGAVINNDLINDDQRLHYNKKHWLDFRFDILEDNYAIAKVGNEYFHDRTNYKPLDVNNLTIDLSYGIDLRYYYTNNYLSRVRENKKTFLENIDININYKLKYLNKMTGGYIKTYLKNKLRKEVDV